MSVSRCTALAAEECTLRDEPNSELRGWTIAHPKRGFPSQDRRRLREHLWGGVYRTQAQITRSAMLATETCVGWVDSKCYSIISAVAHPPLRPHTYRRRFPSNSFLARTTGAYRGARALPLMPLKLGASDFSSRIPVVMCAFVKRHCGIPLPLSGKNPDCDVPTVLPCAVF